MRNASLVLALVTCIAATAAAQQEDAEWYIGKPIRDVLFTGLVSVTQAELRPLVRPYVGKPFTIELYEELRNRLYALDYFDLIEGTANPGDDAKASVIVELAVTERPTVSAVEIRGNAGIRTPSILDAILIKKGDMAAEALVDVDAQTIRGLYLEKGYTKVQVTGRMERDEERNTVAVVFDIVEGQQTKIRNIVFSGNTFASESTLRRLMKTRKQSLLSPGDFQESVLEADKQAILDYYGKNGFIDATIPKVDQNVTDDPETGKSYRDITLYIEEGEQYTFGGLSFEGNELFGDEELEALVRLSPGKPVNTEQLKSAINRVVDRYYSDGYLETGFAPEEQRDAETNEVRYLLRIAESDRVHIESIVLSGNEKTKDYVILRELPFEEGDIYSTAKIRQGIINLSNLQYFSSVLPDFPQGSTRGLRDLVITVEEQSTASFNFGFTVSGGEYPISGKVGWSEANFLGRGQRVSVDAEVSNVRQLLSASFQEPYLLGLRWSGGANFSVSHDRVRNVAQDVLGPVFSDADYTAGTAVPDPYDGHYVYPSGNDLAGQPYDFTAGGTVDPTTLDAAAVAAIVDANDLVTDYVYAGSTVPTAYTMSYDKVAFALGLQTGIRVPTAVGVFRVDPYLSSSVDYKSYDASVFRPYRREDREGFRTWLLVNTLGASLTWDKRDYYVNPQSGFFLRESLASVGGLLFGWKHYLKSTTTAEAYLTLLSRPITDRYTLKLVLGVHSSLAFVLPQWHHDAASGTWVVSSVTERTDLVYIDGLTNARGWRSVLPGKAVWESQVELRLPLAEQLLWWTFFFDAAGIWPEPADIAAMKIEDFYFSFGAGLRFTHPQFPIRVYLSKGFRVDGGVRWKSGDLDLGAFSLDFVVALGGLTF